MPTQQDVPSRSPTAEELEPWRRRRSPAEKLVRRVAGWCGGLGVLLLLILTIAWIAANIGIFTHGTILGYFGATPQALLVLLLACAFYVVFLPLQSMVAGALRYAANRRPEPHFLGKLITFLLWIAAVATIYFLAVYVSVIRDGLFDMLQDYAH